MNYDPNLVLSGKTADQTVRLVFGIWEYRKTIEVPIAGNCLGFSVIESAIENVFDYIDENEDGVPEMTLLDANGTELECSDDEYMGLEWLKNMLISAEIIEIW